MGSYIAAALIIAFFVLSLFVKRLQEKPFLPIVCAALALFFIVSAVTNRGNLYSSSLFAVFGIALAWRYFRMYRDARKRKIAGDNPR
jgi:predicted membrane protein